MIKFLKDLFTGKLISIDDANEVGVGATGMNFPTQAGKALETAEQMVKSGTKKVRKAQVQKSEADATFNGIIARHSSVHARRVTEASHLREDGEDELSRATRIAEAARKISRIG